jgi:hypothetical protein
VIGEKVIGNTPTTYKILPSLGVLGLAFCKVILANTLRLSTRDHTKGTEIPWSINVLAQLSMIGIPNPIKGLLYLGVVEK